MKKMIYLLPILFLIIFSCKQATSSDNHDPYPLVSPENISISSGSATQTVQLVCSVNPDGSFLYDEDGDLVTVVLDSGSTMPDGMSLNEDTGVLEINNTSNFNGTLRFWTVDNIGGSTEDQALVVSFDITPWTVDPGTSTVYVAGYYTDSNEVASYWVNDDSGKVILHDSTKAIGTGIYVYNDNVYVSGYYTNSVPNEVAAYWVNDLSGEVDLYNETVTDLRDARANSIFVSTNGDVLVAGYYFDGTDNFASYWRNNSTDITSLYTDDDSKAYSIYESSGNVYVAGYHYNTKNIASYWTNNLSTREDLSTSPGSFAYSVYYANGSVYVAGKYFSSGYIACYWQDDFSTKTDITGDSVYLQSIMVSGTDVYMAGSYDNGTSIAACYWLNNTAGKVDLFSDTINSDINAEATSIFVIGSDVYVAGYYTSLITSKTVACYWKNGVKTDLTDGTTNSKAYSVFVK